MHVSQLKQLLFRAVVALCVRALFVCGEEKCVRLGGDLEIREGVSLTIKTVVFAGQCCKWRENIKVFNSFNSLLFLLLLFFFSYKSQLLFHRHRSHLFRCTTASLLKIETK